MNKVAVLSQGPNDARSNPVETKSFGGYRFSPDLVMLSDPGGAQAEGIRALRTHIMAQHVQHGRRALAICGPNPGVGCTFVASNLAVALSQIGIKTLLLDGNLRDPSIDRLIVAERPAGDLRSCLESEHGAIAECVDDEVLPNLSVLYSGGAVPNAQELLASERFEDLVNACLRDFDMTIVDTPAANSCADARRISNVVGYAMVVARQGKTFVDDVKTLIAQLRSDDATVIGSLLNKA